MEKHENDQLEQFPQSCPDCPESVHLYGTEHASEATEIVVECDYCDLFMALEDYKEKYLTSNDD